MQKRNPINNNTATIDAQYHIHPFTNAYELQKEGGPKVIKSANGIWVEDDQGNKLLDAMAGLWCVNVGYGRKEIADAVYQQMNKIPYYNGFFKTTTPKTAELAQKIIQLNPKKFAKIFFVNSGSEANDTVIRIVRHYWEIAGQKQKKIIISRKNAYHGSTLGGASLGGMEPMHKLDGLPLPNITHIDQPYDFENIIDITQNPEKEKKFAKISAQKLEQKILEIGPEKIAAFIGEPVQGAGGVIIPPKTYWKHINQICKKYDILLISDEVICGFGRTGEWFGFQKFNINADIIPMAKGLSSGYLPIGAVAVNKRIEEKLYSKNAGEFAHGFTYSGHPACAAAAIENINIIKRENLVEHVKKIEPAFKKALKSLEDIPIVLTTRAVGLLGAIEIGYLEKNKAKRFLKNNQAGLICRDIAIKNNIIMRACGDTMVLSPPLIINQDDINQIISRARKTLTQTTKKIMKSRK